MKITVFNFMQNKSYSQELAGNLRTEADVTWLDMADKKINHCIGCYGCWLKTPGKCIHKDDMEDMYKAYISSDLSVFNVDLSRGFFNSRYKIAQDRLIPLYHPYMDVSKGFFSHQHRYEKYPDEAYIFHRDRESNDFDIANIKNYVKYCLKHTDAKLRFFKEDTNAPEEAANEITAC